jgi:hypothetical protein
MHCRRELASTSAKPSYRQVTPNFLEFGDASGAVPTTIEETKKHSTALGSTRRHKLYRNKQYDLQYDFNGGRDEP